MTAITDLIAQLEQERYSLDNQNVRCSIDTLVAALNEIASGIGPDETPQNANTVFAGPVTGAAAIPAFRSLVNADIPQNLTIGDLNVNSATIPVNGIYLSAANQLAFATATTLRAFFSATGDLTCANGSGYLLRNQAASNIAPTLLPDRGAASTGWGANTGGQISGIIVATEIWRLTASGPQDILTFIVSTLPAASAGNKGTRTFITDGAAVPVFGAIVAGLGTLVLPVFSDGTNWRNG